MSTWCFVEIKRILDGVLDSRHSRRNDNANEFIFYHNQIKTEYDTTTIL